MWWLATNTWHPITTMAHTTETAAVLVVKIAMMTPDEFEQLRAGAKCPQRRILTWKFYKKAKKWVARIEKGECIQRFVW